MSFPFRNNVGNGILHPPPNPPPPSMLTPMGMMGGPGYDNIHQNFNVNPNMMMAGLNDTPLEFNLNKNVSLQPPLPSDIKLMDDFSQRNRGYDEPNLQDMNNSDSRGNGNNRPKSSRDREGRRRDRKDEDKDFNRDRSDRRSDQRGRPNDNHDERSSYGKSKEEKIDDSDPNLNIPGIMFSGMSMYPGNMMGMMGSMMMDPSMMPMGQYPMTDLPQPMAPPEGVLPNPDMSLPLGIPGMNNFSIQQVKESIRLKSCSLVPPYPSSTLPTMRDKPAGCRTVFVGSLPENITDEILSEIFEKCGEITSLRRSKKNFCHIRFAYEHSVDAAVFFNGYKIRIDNKIDTANCSRLHVDYAMARDDQHEWECKQRALQREARHREKMTSRRRPPSPPPISHYTDLDAIDICDKIKQDENFNNAVQVVISWLDRGDCNKKNVNTFYSMIQSTNSHVRRLLNDKTQLEEDLQRVKDETRVKMQTLLIQFGQVEKVFAAASHKKVWDHFSKAQRKNIEMWKKQSSEIRVLQLEDFLQETGGGEEMDVSDEEGGRVIKKSKMEDDHLQEENGNLRCQLEGYKNEIDILKSENQSELDSKVQTIQSLKARVSNLENQLNQCKTLNININKRLENKYKDEDCKDLEKLTEMEDMVDIKVSKDNEAKLIGIISTFLHVHPFGASTDYLWSYVQKMEPELRQNQLEYLLRRYPTVFLQKTSGVGANIERKWVFNGYN